jgi:hypothetical protein
MVLSIGRHTVAMGVLMLDVATVTTVHRLQALHRAGSQRGDKTFYPHG